MASSINDLRRAYYGGGQAFEYNFLEAATTLGYTANQQLLDMFKWPYPAKAVSIHERTAPNNVAALSTGRIHMQLVPLVAGTVVTGIVFHSATTALSAGTHQWFCLADYSTRTILRVTANDTSTAWAANASKSLTLTTPYTVPTTAAYYVGINVTATTPPTLAGTNATHSSIINAPPILCGSGQSGLTTPLAEGVTVNALSASGAQLYCWVY